VKVLDFGLAKVMERATADPDLSNSPTLITGSMAVMIMGTAAYLSPEQARGRPADPRSDIFAFGCVLYEMLTGHQAFHGEDASDILASVMKVDADFNRLPDNLNPRLTDLLRRCLAKNRRERWYAAGDIRIELQSIQAQPQRADATVRAHTPLWRRAVPAVVAAVMAAGVGAGFMWIERPAPRPELIARYSFNLPKDQNFTRLGRPVLAISHDGTRIAYVANNQLYLKSLNEEEAKPIPGTNQDVSTPLFSPDGKWIAYFRAQDKRLEKIPLTGGAAVTLAENIELPYEASWESNGQILMGQVPLGIVSVPDTGGKAETLIAAKPNEIMDGPQLLPNGEILFTAALFVGDVDARWETSKIVVQNLKTGERKVIVQAGSSARYLPTGHLVYAVGATVYAVPFDPRKLQVLAGSVPVLEGVRRSQLGTTAAAFFSLSDDGALAYIPGGTTADLSRVLVLADRSGATRVLPLPTAGYDVPRFSPDGKHIAVGIRDTREFNIWIYDLEGSTSIRRLTFGGRNQVPAWTPDGKRIVFRSDRDGEGLYWQAADGNGVAERLSTAEKDTYQFPLGWTPDGKTLAFYVSSPNGGGSVWTLNLDGDRKPKPLVVSSAVLSNIRRISFSPDGQWIAYSSNEESNFSVYVQPYPPTGAKYKISTKGGGDSPFWSHDGKQLVFSSGTGLKFVDIQTKPAFAVSEPKPLPITIENTQGRPYDISQDGKTFLVMQRPAETGSSEKAALQINVVLNWFRELQDRVPVK
jgi:Tol biopolymer transport system component